MIPEAAVEAAEAAWLGVAFESGSWTLKNNLRAALEAAAPHMLAEAKADAWDECEKAQYEIRLNGAGDTWEPVKDNPYR